MTLTILLTNSELKNKELKLDDRAIEALFDDFIKTTSIDIEVKAELVKQIVKGLPLIEQAYLLEEIEEEKIFPLSHLVAT